jgi:hypothetical protein
MAHDLKRNVLTFNLEVVSKFPAIRKAKMEECRWLIGVWAAENRVRATPTTPAYADAYVYTYDWADNETRITVSGPSGKSRPLLTFDPFSNRWMMTFIDGLYGVLQSDGWQGDRIIFIGNLTMLGVDCQLRQTLTRKSENEAHILNEERLPDGSWQVTDEFYCTRK